MPKFNMTETPRETLWGAPQTATQLLPGIWEVHTSSHGGMILSDERQAAMPAALRLDSTSYEEDVDWALVVLGFANEFAGLPTKGFDLLVQNARASVRAWHPDRYAAHTGEAVETSDSPILRRRQAWIVDFDKCEVRTGETWKEQNLARLLRSLRKERTRREIFCWEENNWKLLTTSYSETPVARHSRAASSHL